MRKKLKKHFNIHSLLGLILASGVLVFIYWLALLVIGIFSKSVPYGKVFFDDKAIMVIPVIIASSIAILIYFSNSSKKTKDTDNNSSNYQDIFSNKKKVNNFFKKRISADTFEDILVHFARYSEYVYVFNWNMDYWKEPDSNKQCSRMIQAVINRAQNIVFSSLFCRVFILTRSECNEHKEKLIDISEKHANTYQTVNKIYVNKNENSITNFEIDNIASISVMLYVYANNATDGFFLLKCKEKGNTNDSHLYFPKGTDQYKSIIKSAIIFVKESSDLRTITYKDSLIKILDNIDKQIYINKIKNYFAKENSFMLSHNDFNEMKGIKENE